MQDLFGRNKFFLLIRFTDGQGFRFRSGRADIRRVDDGWLASFVVYEGFCLKAPLVKGQERNR